MEMFSWLGAKMRKASSPAHATRCDGEQEDLRSLVLELQNKFENNCNQFKEEREQWLQERGDLLAKVEHRDTRLAKLRSRMKRVEKAQKPIKVIDSGVAE
jgi:cell division septum initiation protein DivIVA